MKKKKEERKDETLELFDLNDRELRRLYLEATEMSEKIRILQELQSNSEKRGAYANERMGKTNDERKNASDKKHSTARLVIEPIVTLGTTAATMAFARSVQKSEHSFASDGNFYDKTSSDFIKRYVIDPCSKAVSNVTDFFHKK